MHNRLFFNFILCGLLSAGPLVYAETSFPAPAVISSNPITLGDAYAASLKQSETLAIREELIKEAEAHFMQSLSGIFPRASFEASETWEDVNDGSTRSPQRGFVFHQPLFSGFKEFAAMAASKAEGRQRKEEVKRARQLLFKDVSDAFYFFLSYQEDIEALDKIQKALADRLRELEKREHLGRSRASEVASAQARLSRLEAELELTYSQRDVTRQLLEFLTGLEVISVKDDLDINITWKDEQDYNDQTKGRPDVIAAGEAVKVANNEVTVARAGFLPVVDVNSNYYTKQTGSSAGQDWDVMLRVTIPIFTGGQTLGQVREQQSQARQAKLQRQLIERRAVNDVKNALVQLKSAIKRKEALAKALSAVQKNYELQEEDYRRSLVNNLDVLQALEDLQDSQREFIAVSNELKRMYWNFQVSLGTVDYDTF